MKKRSKKVTGRLPWTSPNDSDSDYDYDEPLPYFSFRSELTRTLSTSEVIEMIQKNIDEIRFKGEKQNIEKGELSLGELLLIKAILDPSFDVIKKSSNDKPIFKFSKFNFKKLFCFF